jgi:hypothetical protein
MGGKALERWLVLVWDDIYGRFVEEKSLWELERLTCELEKRFSYPSDQCLREELVFFVDSRSAILSIWSQQTCSQQPFVTFVCEFQLF